MKGINKENGDLEARQNQILEEDHCAKAIPQMYCYK